MDFRISEIDRDSTTYFPFLFKTIEIEDCFGPTKIIYNLVIPGLSNIFEIGDFQNVEICKKNDFEHVLGLSCIC